MSARKQIADLMYSALVGQAAGEGVRQLIYQLISESSDQVTEVSRP